MQIYSQYFFFCHFFYNHPSLLNKKKEQFILKKETFFMEIEDHLQAVASFFSTKQQHVYKERKMFFAVLVQTLQKCLMSVKMNVHIVAINVS